MQRHSRPNTSSTKTKIETKERGEKARLCEVKDMFVVQTSQTHFTVSQINWPSCNVHASRMNMSDCLDYCTLKKKLIPLFLCDLYACSYQYSVPRLIGSNSLTRWTELGACTCSFSVLRRKDKLYKHESKVMLSMHAEEQFLHTTFVGLGFK